MVLILWGLVNRQSGESGHGESVNWLKKTVGTLHAKITFQSSDTSS